MPIYQYHCASCETDLEIFQRMTDPALTVCPQCQAGLRKVFSPVGIVFKGSGFYATDSKKNSTSTSLPPADTKSASAAKPSTAAAPTSSETAASPSEQATPTT